MKAEAELQQVQIDANEKRGPAWIYQPRCATRSRYAWAYLDGKGERSYEKEIL